LYIVRYGRVKAMKNIYIGVGIFAAIILGLICAAVGGIYFTFEHFLPFLVGVSS